MRSASVDFPWSMWAMIEKLRMLVAGAAMHRVWRWTRPPRLRPAPGAQQVVHLLLLAHDHVLEPVLDGLRGGLAPGRLDRRLECLERLALVLDQPIDRLGRVAGEAQGRHVRG